MEIEAKFRITDDKTFHTLLLRDELGPFHLAPASQPEQQHNTYFDTADGTLRRQRYGLRVRDLGTRRVATLKGETHFHDGVHEREEWEADIGAEDAPAAWPPSEVRERALALGAGMPLLPLLTIQTQRQHIYASYDQQRVAEISLDQGVISAGERQESFRELEVELLSSGTRAHFDTLVALLRQQFALIPEERSKLARGLALLEQNT